MVTIVSKQVAAFILSIKDFFYPDDGGSSFLRSADNHQVDRRQHNPEYLKLRMLI
jgi:hypothetical protein